MIDLALFDKTKFTNTPFAQRIEKPWGYEIIFTPPTLSYTGKILHIRTNKRLSLQVHDKKQETQFLLSGQCNLIADDVAGNLQTIPMEKGQGYTIMIGQRHRLQSVEECDILEVSTPELGTTYRLEDDYKRPDETPEQRKKEREKS